MQRLNAKVRRWGDWARYARATRSAGARPNANCRARGASALRPSSDSMSSRRRWTRCAGRWNVSISRPVSCIALSTCEALIEQAARRIESLGVGECAKLAKYLRNRAPGLALAQKSVLPRLEALAEPWSAQAVSLACICWYLVRALHKRPARARYRALSRHLLGAYGALHDQTRRRERIAARGRRGGAAPTPSRLECHRGVQRDTAPLSLRAQRRHPGLSRPVPCLVQSAHAALGTAQGDQRSHECLTRQRVHDWLTLLGYPPSPTLN